MKSEVKKYTEYILEKNKCSDICDINYTYGQGNQPVEVARAGVIDLGKYLGESHNHQRVLV